MRVLVFVQLDSNMHYRNLPTALHCHSGSTFPSEALDIEQGLISFWIRQFAKINLPNWRTSVLFWVLKKQSNKTSPWREVKKWAVFYSFFECGRSVGKRVVVIVSKLDGIGRVSRHEEIFLLYHALGRIKNSESRKSAYRILCQNTCCSCNNKNS